MLTEVLVALVVAALLLLVLGRGFAGTWGAARAPAEVLIGISMAEQQVEADRDRTDLPAGYRVSRRVQALTFLERPSNLAPPPANATSTPPAPPDAAGPQQGRDIAHNLRLKGLDATVRTPAGRLIQLDVLKLDAAPP